MARLQNATRPARLYRPRLAPGRLPLEAPRRPDCPAGRERLHIRMRRARPDAATTIPAAQEVLLPVCPVRTIPQAAATPRHAPALPQSLFQNITCLVEGTLEPLVRHLFLLLIHSLFCGSGSILNLIFSTQFYITAPPQNPTVAYLERKSSGRGLSGEE